MAPFPLLSLPPELRNQIYLYALESSTRAAHTLFLTGHMRYPRPATPLSLLLTNHQINVEATPLFHLHRYWQSFIVHESHLWDFRDPVLHLGLPNQTPISSIQNLEITILAPREGEYDDDDGDDYQPRQQDLTGTMAKLLCILVDEIAAHRPNNSPLKNLLIHLPCLCPTCPSPAPSTFRPSTIPADGEWKKGLTPCSLSILLHPLKRLRASHTIEFLYDCSSPFPAALQPVLQDIAEVVGGAKPVAALEGERGVFRELWMEAREKGMEEVVLEDLIYLLWAVDHGFPGRMKWQGRWVSKEVRRLRELIRGQGDE
ncbi:MAG: hypothetical protein Q9180_005583 [Flavoplaca navasiana]